MEQLTLPPPARDLFRQVYGALDELIRPMSPAGTSGRLGGATTLAARWQHRRSTDIDITVPIGTGLGRYDPNRDPRLVERMDAWRRGNRRAPILDPPYRTSRRTRG